MNLAVVKEFVVNYLSGKLNPVFHYHDLAHTLDVHESVIRIAGGEDISREEMQLLETAALFHDIGMTEQYDDHEIASVALSRSLLPGLGYNEREIEMVCSLIMATKLPTGPLTLPERIICDADLDYLGRSDFFMRSFQLRTEWELFGVMNCDPVEWLQFEAVFLRTHDYFTDSARTLREAGKKHNLDYIELFLECVNK
jgi:uncharacterized protein